MATSQMSEVLQHLRYAVLLRDGAGLTDGQLLTRFLHERDETAFAALVKRQGPMVWGVCRRILRNHHDAEDAFQATFLVLLRRAATVVPCEMVANWLYGVAHQTALKARALAAKRKDRERQVVEMPESHGIEQDIWSDLQPVLDEELSRLPDKYRVAIVLCDMQGKTRQQVAQQLALPPGTVAGRLTRGRAMLAKRLARRGLVVSCGSLAAVVSQNAAAAGVPLAVVSNTIQAASLLVAAMAGTTGAVSATVAALMEGVHKTMWMAKLKSALPRFIIAGLLSLVAGVGILGIFQGANAIMDGVPIAEAEGELVPKKRVGIFSPTSGTVMAFSPKVKPGASVARGDRLVRMYSADLAKGIVETRSTITNAKEQVKMFKVVPPNENTDAKFNREKQLIDAQITEVFENKKLEKMRALYNADLDRPGEFWLLSPLKGIVLASDFREKLTGIEVNPNQQLILIGSLDHTQSKRDDWEIELRIPQKNLRRILSAFQGNDPLEELDLDLLLTSQPTATYKGKLARSAISAGAKKAEPMILAYVRISPKMVNGQNDIPENNLVPISLLMNGVEAHVRIHRVQPAKGKG